MFPGATHSAYEHSLGTLALSRALSEPLIGDEEIVNTIGLAALLRGHVRKGPFAPVFKHLCAWLSDRRNADTTQTAISKGTLIRLERDKELETVDFDLLRYLLSDRVERTGKVTEDQLKAWILLNGPLGAA